MTLWLLELFAEHGLDLLMGSSALLSLGALAMWAHSRPIHVQRVGELTLLTVLCWLALAVVPMPRFDWDLGARSSATPISGELERHLSFESLGPEAQPLAARDASRPPALNAPRPPGQEPRSAAVERGSPADVAPVAAPGAAAGSEGAADIGTGAVVATYPGPSVAARPASETEAATGSAAGSAAAGTLPWAKLAAALFLGGSALAAGYLLLGFLRLRRILKTATPAPDWVRQLLAADAQSLAAVADPLPRVLVSELRCGPFCVGVFRPTIVLPARLVAARSSALRHVLLHEVAHARQGDGRGQLLVALAMPVLWFHPLYWWVRKRVRFAAELLADDQATGIVSRGTYARELIGLAETGWPSSPSPVAAPTILRSPSEFSRRIEMLLSRTDRLSTRCSRTRARVQALAACGLVALATGFFGAPPAAAQHADDYARLMAEKEQLMEQMRQMQDVMAELRAQMEMTRASQHAERARADEQAAHLDQRHAEFEAVRRELESKLASVDVQRADAEAMREFLEQELAAVAEAGEGTTWRELITGQAHAAREGDAESADLYRRQLSEEYAAAGARKAALAAQQADARVREVEEQLRAQEVSGSVLGIGTGSGGGTIVAGRPQPTLDPGTLELVTSAIDLDGDIRLAELELLRNEELYTEGLVSDTEMMQSRVVIETLQRKSKLIRSLLVAELQAAEAELSALSDSAANRAPRTRLQARMEILAGMLELPGGRGKSKDVQSGAR